MKKCIACRSEIDDDATICTTCNSHQAKWHNWLPYASGVAAVLALIGSMLTYIIATSIDIFTKLGWNDDIQIVSLRYGEDTRSLTVLNVGDGPLYLRDVTIKSKIPANRGVITHSGFEITDKVVPPHEFYSYFAADRPDDVTEDEARRSQFSREIQEAIVSHVTEEEWKLMLDNYEHDKCVNLMYYAENDPIFIHWKTFLGGNLRTTDATVEISFVSPKDGAVKLRTFSAKGVLHFDQRPECNKYSQTNHIQQEPTSD